MPFKLGSKVVVISHLEFADDMMFFCFDKEDSFLILNYILGFFEAMSGLKLIGVSYFWHKEIVSKKSLLDGWLCLVAKLGLFPLPISTSPWEEVI